MEMCEVRQCSKEVVQVCSSLQLSNTPQEERKVTVKHQQTCSVYKLLYTSKKGRPGHEAMIL